MARDLIKPGQVADSRRLFDMISRQQLYVEGVKQNMAADFREVTRQISAELSTLLSKLNYRTLDGMTKAEINRFIVTLRKTQNNLYSIHTERLLDQLYLFMQEDKTVTRAVYAAWLLGIDDPKRLTPKVVEAVLKEASESSKGLFGWLPVGTDAKSDAAMWSAVAAAVIPASGAYLGAYLSAFATSSKVSLENLVRRGYANGWTPSELMAQVNGTAAAGFRDGLTRRIDNNANEAVDTITQHVASVIATAIASIAAAGAASVSESGDYVPTPAEIAGGSKNPPTGANATKATAADTILAAAGVASAANIVPGAGWYRWCSIIDRATSSICRYRNKRLYQFGVGPRPPAHPRCRSQILAVRSPKEKVVDVSYFDWVMVQPPHVIVSLFAPDIAKSIADGTMTSERLSRFSSTFSLTAEEYGDQLSNIIGR